MPRVAEMLGDRQCREPRAPARARRLVHLPEDESGAVEDARSPEFEQQLVPFARALADAGEDRNPRVALDGGADQLHDQHGLADPGAAEHRRLAALDERRQQIDDLDAGVKDFAAPGEAVERGRRRVDRPARDAGGERRAAVDGFTRHVDEAAEHRVADRRRDRPAERACLGIPLEPGRGPQRHRPHARGAQMLLHFGEDRRAAIPLDRHRLVDARQCFIREGNVDDRAMDRDDAARGRVSRRSLEAHPKGSQRVFATQSSPTLR
jgi:hypothetical protein